MAAINQYSSLASIEKSLAATGQLVDARTEQDWLFFLGEFAALINFYDQDNAVNGNWAPFLLKDPVFLLASIAKTKVKEMYAVYAKTRSKLQQLFAAGTALGKIGIGVNELLEQIFHVFLCIKKWLYYLQTTVEVYELKTYIVQQVRTIYGPYFSAIATLRQALFATTVIPGVSRPDNHVLNPFEAQVELVWNSFEDQTSYWEVLSLAHPINSNEPEAIFKAIVKAGDEIFAFFNHIVIHAQEGFEKLSLQKSVHPDTTLLRSFVHLLKLQQEDLNQLSAKHLDFYYQDILRQQAKVAKADRAFVCAELMATDSLVWLPAHTALDAGVDGDKNPVYFANSKGLWLNPAKILNVHSLSKRAQANNQISFLLDKLADPGTLKRDADNQLMAWPMFTATASAAPVTMGIAFASPMLLLREGDRLIRINIDYDGLLDEAILNSLSYELSTATGWLGIVPVSAAIVLGPVKQLSLQFKLTPDLPAIEPLIDPSLNGFLSEWPMFRITFQVFSALGEMGNIAALDIEVEVAAINGLQLYNDNGGLMPKGPYPIFGAAPALNSNFLIGSNEIFSKPLQRLSLALAWSKLPDDFGIYYKAYNDYLHQKWDEAHQPQRSWIGRLLHWIKSWFVKDSGEEIFEDPYYNHGFKVDFKLLQSKTWTLLNAVSETDPTHIPASVPLFDEDNDFKLLPASHFICQPVSPVLRPDAAIQLKPLLYNEESASGFAKLQLVEPAYGFGGELYPAIVYEQALANARLISKRNKKFEEPAKLPFVPMLNSTQAGYTARQRYVFGQPSVDDYPLSCYHFTPFGNYLVNDSAQGRLNQSFAFGTASAQTLPFTPVFPYQGFLFLEIANLLPSPALAIYLELKPHLGVKTPLSPVVYYCLGQAGWQALDVVSDGTNNLSISGIVELKIPQQCSSQHQAMPQGKFWICAATPDDPSLFADAFFMKTNGFESERLPGNWQTSNQVPLLQANAIVQPRLKMTAIQSLAQPFASFGGRAPEEALSMNRRIGRRLKTRDRLRSKDDCLLLVRSEFPEVFYAKSVYSQANRSTTIYLVGKLKNWLGSSALLPTLSPNLLQEVQSYIGQRSSAFTGIQTQAFEIQYLQVSAKITSRDGFDPNSVKQTVNASLNLYLSPWAESDTEQIVVGEPIGIAQLLHFIKKIEGVADVADVSLQTWLAADPLTGQGGVTVRPFKESCLIVPCSTHQINVSQL